MRTLSEDAISEPVIDAPPHATALGTFLEPVLGAPAWGVRQGYGSFLTFEFGEPTLEVRESNRNGQTKREAYVHGQWHLWIDCCHWRIFQDGVALAWSEDTEKEIARATATLNGQKLLGVKINASDGRSTFAFDLGGSLETWPYGDDPTEEQWHIYAPDEVFSYRADGYYSRQPADTPVEDERWTPAG